MTRSGSFWPNNSAVIVNNNSPDGICPRPGITLTFGLTLTILRTRTNMNNSCDKYSLSFKMEIQLLITTCGVSIKYFWVFIPEQTCAASRRKRN